MNVKRMYNELLATSIILNLFESLLTATAVFSVIYFVLYFYRINYLYGLIAAALFFARSLIVRIRENKILLLERKYPDLRERLRTSFDHQSKSNQVINELHSDVILLMKKVDVNAFLNSKKLFLKVSAICGLLFATLYLSSIGLDIIDIKNTVVNSVVYEKTTGFLKETFQDREEIRDRPLLDQPQLINLGNKELNITIETYNTELDISEISDEKNDYGGHFPEEVEGVAQQTYQEKIPEEHKEVIKEYFKKINN